MSPKGQKKAQKSRMGKIAFFSGCLLAIPSVFLAAYRPLESATIFHSSEPQYGITLVSLESQEISFGHRQTDVVLEVLDRSQSVEFKKFKEIEEQVNSPTHDLRDYQQQKGRIQLQMIRKDGTYETVSVDKIYSLINSAVSADGKSQITLVFTEPYRSGNRDEVFERYSLQLVDFPPLLIQPTNPLVKRLPLLSKLQPVMLAIVGTLAMVLGGLTWYDAKPIPDDFIESPVSLSLSEGEPWRAKTSFRYLEQLKAGYTSLESFTRSLHQEAVDAHRQLPQSKGYLMYRRLRSTVERCGSQVAANIAGLESLKAHIDKVFAGDVRDDLQRLEEQAQKNRRERTEQEEEIARTVEQIRLETNKEKPNEAQLDYWKGYIHRSRGSVKELDMKHIELVSTIKELRDFDFQKLYRELGVSSETMRQETETLEEIKKKADVVTQITPHVSGVAKTEDDKKMEAAGRRIKNDIKFGVGQRLGKKLSTLEEIQRFFKEQSEAIKNNSALSYDDKTEQLAQLTRDCDEYKKELKTDVSVYEED